MHGGSDRQLQQNRYAKTFMLVLIIGRKEGVEGEEQRTSHKSTKNGAEPHFKQFEECVDLMRHGLAPSGSQCWCNCEYRNAADQTSQHAAKGDLLVKLAED